MSKPRSHRRTRSTAWDNLLRVARLARKPLERFLKREASSGILLLIATAVALLWANSPWAKYYFDLWEQPLHLRLGSHVFERTVEWFVNDVLMVVFFFVVGLEIRRETHHGELSDLRRASLPVAAALGGMVIPASLYLSIAHAPPVHAGWGIPMATDIAFALGVLAILGPRVPPALRVLLLALAVIDDLGAILVIAVFYSSGILWTGLFVAICGVVAVLVMQRLGVRRKAAYLAPGFVIWAGVYGAGVHPTIAGVIIGLLTPVDHDDAADGEALPPVESLIESLHPWVAFVIMPLFALANAGVALTGESLDASATRVAVASALGLFIGKPIGVLLACFLALKLRVSALPRGLHARHLLVLGAVAGIGFTMSLFIAQLAFANAALLAAAKLGVLIASFCAAVFALGLGRLLLTHGMTEGAATTADEAESSTEL